MDARHTGTILDRIVADRRTRLAEDRRERDEDELRRRIEAAPPVVDFASRLCDGRRASPEHARLRLIAEIKRASPSKGLFDPDLDAAAQARQYADAGASAISVLTEPDHFQGSIGDLHAVSETLRDDPDRPAILRKEFIFDPYQVLEARAFGADALLLIVMMLERETLSHLLAATRDLGMQPLVEVHDEKELEVALETGATVIGMNNRDLRTFSEDLGVTERLAGRMPSNITLIAESGIRSAEDARRMADAGAHALLVGEALMRTGNIAEMAHTLLLTGDEART